MASKVLSKGETSPRAAEAGALAKSSIRVALRAATRHRVCGRFARRVVNAWCVAAVLSGVVMPERGVARADDVVALIATPSCRDDADCATVAVGAKACGGPERWLAWSRRVTDETTLRAAAAREAEEVRARLRAEGAASDCRFVSDPGATCVVGPEGGEGRCMLRAMEAGTPR